MDRILPLRALRVSSVLALAALSATLSIPSVASAGVSSTAHYGYRVTGVQYTANGQLSAGRLPGGCVGIALWEGDVTTKLGGQGELVALANGKASLLIHSHGTSGTVDANAEVESQLSNAFYRETTACDQSESETAFALTPCTQTVDSSLHIHVRISGGVGTHVKLSWIFFQHNGAAGKLVPDTFSCREPLQFPDGTCTTRATLNTFTRKVLTLPFSCLFSSQAPPAGRGATKYASVVTATGSIRLKRTP
jgi:hypothetical protein